MVGQVFQRCGRLAARVVTPWVRQVKATLGVHREYAMGRFTIRLPAEHLLPDYQKLHRRYDKFLPHLARYLEAGATVVDVGANCGDSVAAMVEANSQLHYICVEPDDTFYRYLELNAERLRTAQNGASILLHKALIGKSVSAAQLEGSNGTSHAVVAKNCHVGNTIASITLDSMQSLSYMNSVRLLKSDVDGFDYDVLDSAEKLISEQAPMLFFECQFTDLDQKNAYQQTITRLAKSGYAEWTVFDNYGEVILRNADLHTLFQLFDYVWRQNVGSATRTIVYFDLLGSTATYKSLIESAVSAYVSS